MASIYYRGAPPAGSWWVRLYHPQDGKPIRESLETTDEARAKLLCRRIELEAELARPEFSLIAVPSTVLEKMGRLQQTPPLASDNPVPLTPSKISPPTAESPILAPLEQPPAPSVSPSPAGISPSIAKALEVYLAHITLENEDHHIEGKKSMLRKFFGPQLLPYKKKPRKGKAVEAGFFTGEMLTEIDSPLVLKFLSGLEIARKSKRHYRELFHNFFEVMLANGLYHPTNFHRPNPMSALPSFSDRGRRKIIFLKDADLAPQREVLRAHPSLRAAFEIMCEGGLRRSEALWLTKDAFSKSLDEFSVMNIADPEDDEEESSLKTDNSTRRVVILPPLRNFLEKYLPTLEGPWLVPSPEGKRWNPDNFSAALRKVNQAANLKWSSRHYRCTYGTRRAREGWSIHDLAHQMGTSYAMIERHYAAFISPSRIARSGPP